MSKACDSQESSTSSAALIPPCAAFECERTGWTLLMIPTETPFSAAARAARCPASPAPITNTSCSGTGRILCGRRGGRRAAIPSAGRLFRSTSTEKPVDRRPACISAPDEFAVGVEEGRPAEAPGGGAGRGRAAAAAAHLGARSAAPPCSPRSSSCPDRDQLRRLRRRLRQRRRRRFEGIPQSGIALGDPKAPVTMVEFARSAMPVLPASTRPTSCRRWSRSTCSPATCGWSCTC